MRTEWRTAWRAEWRAEWIRSATGHLELPPATWKWKMTESMAEGLTYH